MMEVLLLLLLSLVGCFCLDSISLTPPTLTEEERRSLHMPGQHKCEGCLAVGYQLATAFGKAHDKAPSGGLPESDVISTAEEVCDKAFHSYGLVEENGIKRISGPGLQESKKATLTQMGGLWASRLQDMCDYYTGELDEYSLYKVWQKTPTKFIDYLCRGKDIRGACVPGEKLPHEIFEEERQEDEELADMLIKRGREEL